MKLYWHPWPGSKWNHCKRSSCKIRDDQAIKMSVCAAQLEVKMGPVLWLHPHPAHLQLAIKGQGSISGAIKQSRSKNGPDQILIPVAGVSTAGIYVTTPCYSLRTNLRVTVCAHMGVHVCVLMCIHVCMCIIWDAYASRGPQQKKSRTPCLEINGNQQKSTEINQEITRNYLMKSLAVAGPPTFTY